MHGEVVLAKEGWSAMLKIIKEWVTETRPHVVGGMVTAISQELRKYHRVVLSLLQDRKSGNNLCPMENPKGKKQGWGQLCQLESIQEANTPLLIEIPWDSEGRGKKKNLEAYQEIQEI